MVKTYLHIASINCDAAAVERHLKQNPGWVNKKDDADATPLHYAAARGHEQCVRLLLAAGADTKARNKNDNTPLHSAAIGGHEQCVRLLLEGGADPKARDNDGLTPLAEARERGRSAVVKILEGWEREQAAAKAKAEREAAKAKAEREAAKVQALGWSVGAACVCDIDDAGTKLSRGDRGKVLGPGTSDGDDLYGDAAQRVLVDFGAKGKVNMLATSQIITVQEHERREAEKAAKAKAEREAAAKAKAEREAAAKAKAEREAAAKAKAEREAAEKAAREKAAREKAAREKAARLGLLEPLQALQLDAAALAQAIRTANAFCDEQGATSVADLVECVLIFELAAELGLKTVQMKQLQKNLEQAAGGKKAAPPTQAMAGLSVPSSGGAPVTEKAWFHQWVSKVLGCIKEASLNGFESVMLLQIKPDVEDEKTFARTEWPEFKRLLEEAYTRESDEVKRIPFDALNWAEFPSVERLPKYLEKQVDEDTCVIVASCPGSKMEEVEQVIMQFKRDHKALRSNLNLAYSQKEGANKWLGKK